MKKSLTLLSALLLIFLSSCMPVPADGSGDAAAGSQYSMILSVGIMLFFFVMMYFIAIRPQRKQEKEQKAMLSSMAVGDTVLTTSGFYGVVIDITDDTIIVEFGNNKNCRIPMQKSAVVRLEHPEGWTTPEVEAKDDSKDAKKDKEKK